MTLPVTIIYGILMSLLVGVIQKELWLQAICVIATTYTMILINNSNVLIRIYSRLVSCTFLALTIMTSFLNKDIESYLIQFLFAAHLLTFFKSYQNKRSMNYVFTSFITIGIISTIFIQILFIVPILWLLLGTRMQAGSAKNFAASIIGLIVPYWFWGIYSLSADSYTTITNHILGLVEIVPLSTAILEPHTLISLTFITLLGISGILHFIRYSYNDSIKTRMLYYSLITIFWVLLLLIILQPQHNKFTFKILIVVASPIIAHYFTFTKSWITNYYFIASLITTILLTVYNTWIF